MKGWRMRMMIERVVAVRGRVGGMGSLQGPFIVSKACGGEYRWQ
jgi:hypothetical protein